MWLFYLIIFLIPSNLGKHFVLPSSFVGGSLVDYLIPTLYLTDILIIFLLILQPLNWRQLPQPILVFLLVLLPSVVVAASPVPAVYKWLKLAEMGLLAAWVKQYRVTVNLTIVKLTVTVAIIFQSVLAVGQWLNQGSLLGYYFLGEQPYSTATAGIDKITWFDGSLKLPPLGTTPHPNVLAGFLVIAAACLQGRTLKALTAIPVFLTFSLSAWIAWLIRNKWTWLAGLAALIIFGHRLSFLAPESSFSRRSQLAKMAVNMWQDHPLTGVGLNNFTVVMDQYGYIPASTRFLQPVHNIYLLFLAETGLLGAAGFAYLLLQGRTLKAFGICPGGLPLLLFLGLFDHWPITLQTGLLLFSLL